MLKVDNLFYQYHPENPVLKDINFTLKKGEHLCVMGESGSGKSTLLKVIYGLYDVNQGSIFWDDIQVLGPKEHLVPGIEFFKYVAQDFDLMSFISVSENIKKFLSRFYPKEAQKRTDELLEVIEMTAFANTKVKYLSGGQQQRVAIARALAKEPKLLLLDEPFGQIDNFKKNSLRRNLFGYLKEKNISCIIATHDKDDALSFADTLIVIKNSEIIANNSPLKIYQNPSEKYIATLFDDINEIIIDGKLELVYPHQIKKGEKSTLKAIVSNSFFKGFFWLIELEFNQQKIYMNHFLSLKKGQKISFSITK